MISKEPKNAIELMKIFSLKGAPEIKELIDRILLENPDLTSFDLRKGTGINLDKVASIAIMDFIVTAFSDKRTGWEHGYIPTRPKN